MNKTDQLYRYLFEHHQVRGELVQLATTFQHMVEAQAYPPAVQALLGELLVATSLLTATLKFEGSITVQLQGNGPVRLAEVATLEVAGGPAVISRYDRARNVKSVRSSPASSWRWRQPALSATASSRPRTSRR